MGAWRFLSRCHLGERSPEWRPWARLRRHTENSDAILWLSAVAACRTAPMSSACAPSSSLARGEFLSTPSRSGRRPGRIARARAGNAQLLDDIRRQIPEWHSYGYRRACALVNRLRAVSVRQAPSTSGRSDKVQASPEGGRSDASMLVEGFNGLLHPSLG
jgi:hypothetical protein